MSDKKPTIPGLRGVLTTTRPASVATRSLGGMLGQSSPMTPRGPSAQASAIVGAHRTAVQAGEVKTAIKSNRLIFVIDATGSRERTWQEAQDIMGSMFDDLDKMDLASLQIRVMTFGGGQGAHDIQRGVVWHDNKTVMKGAMRQVHCNVGETQYEDAFTKVLRDHEPNDTIIMIGDCFEEYYDDNVRPHVRRLGNAGTRIFTFHEGNDREAKEVFKQIARETGGAFAKFEPGANLGALIRAAAAFAAGGNDALQALIAAGNKDAKLLQDGMRENTLRLSGPAAPQ